MKKKNYFILIRLLVGISFGFILYIQFLVKIPDVLEKHQLLFVSFPIFILILALFTNLFGRKTKRIPLDNVEYYTNGVFYKSNDLMAIRAILVLLFYFCIVLAWITLSVIHLHMVGNSILKSFSVILIFSYFFGWIGKKIGLFFNEIFKIKPPS